MDACSTKIVGPRSFIPFGQYIHPLGSDRPPWAAGELKISNGKTQGRLSKQKEWRTCLAFRDFSGEVKCIDQSDNSTTSEETCSNKTLFFYMHKRPTFWHVAFVGIWLSNYFCSHKTKIGPRFYVCTELHPAWAWGFSIGCITRLHYRQAEQAVVLRGAILNHDHHLSLEK